MKEIEIDRKLLNPHFDGYKLSLDPLPIYDLLLESDIDSAQLSHDIYSYQHFKLFGSHNRLYRDPWCEDAAWFVTCNWEIQKVHFNSQHVPNFKGPVSCYSIPNDETNRSVKNKYPVSLSFPDENFLVICDGTGRLIILKTSDRRNEYTKCEEWYSGTPLGEDVEFQAVQTESHISEGIHYLEILCIFISKGEKTPEIQPFTYLEWLTFNLVSTNQFNLSRRRTLQTTCLPDFAAIVGNGTKIVICNEKGVKFIKDSLKPNMVETENITDFGNSCAPLYTWTQNGREVKVVIRLKDEISASDIKYSLSHDSIQLKINTNDDCLLSGKLANSIVLEDCTWNITGSMLEICLKKADDSPWLELIANDTNGPLEHGEHDTDICLLEGAEESRPYNNQELEECDYLNNSTFMYWFDGCSHINEQIILTSNQWLFSHVSLLSNVPLICIRHDVDGLVFKLGNDSHPTRYEWKHIASFNALGYVQASKQQRKFTICAPDFSYVAIIEVSRHIFIYRQPCLSSVKSRKTNSNVMVALHHMVTLETRDTIEGALATNNHLFILTKRRLQCIRVN